MYTNCASACHAVPEEASVVAAAPPQSMLSSGVVSMAAVGAAVTARVGARVGTPVGARVDGAAVVPGCAVGAGLVGVPAGQKRISYVLLRLYVCHTGGVGPVNAPE